MSRWGKILNLYRLNTKNVIGILSLLWKKYWKIDLSQKEIEKYTLYNYMIRLNGNLVEETDQSFLLVFKNKRRDKIKVRKFPSSDLNVFQQVFFWKGYLPIIKIYQDNFRHKDDSSINILDCGSNIGLASLFFLKFFPEAKIVAIEPEKSNFEILNYNLNNSNYKNVFNLKGVVWSKSCKMKVVNDFRDKNDWSFRVEETEEEDHITAYTIDDILRLFNIGSIDILKIDIEGSEKELFTSPEANLDFLKITKCIALEIHDEFNCREDIYRILKENNFILTNSGELTLGYNEELVKAKVPN